MAAPVISTAGASGPQHCLHKLPTCCQLTSLPTCCACGDKRPHNQSYSRYLDGIGFCLGGRRQERYCPNCQIFWDTRIAVSGTPQSTTRIPDHPDQSDFIRQWFDWHRGYTIIDRQDGTQERKELIGDTLSEVDIGRLPRTLEQLQAPVQRQRLRQRLRGSSTYIPSSNPYYDDARFHTRSISGQEQAANPSMNPSQTVAAPRIDPEDRIFDSPSSSVSSVGSDTEDYEDDIIPARQQLLSTLQESLDDIRANVLELTQQTPEPRNDSQVSAVTDQISSISGRITQIRQQSLARLQHQQNASINRTMSSPRQNPTSPNPAVEENGDASLATLRSAHNYSIGDEALRRQIMALNREESVARATILAPEESSGGREAAISHLNHVTRQRRQAEQEQARRERLPHLLGTLEERQGAEEPSPIASLFARQVSTQPEPQDYVSRYNNSVAASEQQSQDYNRIWTSRLRAFRGGLPQASDPFTHAYYGFSGIPPNLPNATAPTHNPPNLQYTTIPSGNPMASARPRHWLPFANPASNARSNSHRTRPSPRRRSNQSEQEPRPSSPYILPPLSREGLDGPHDRFLPTSHVNSSFRETTSPASGTADDAAFRASRTRFEALPSLTGAQLLSSLDEPVANGPLTDAETYRVWTQRYHPGQVARGQSNQPRASLDTDSTRPEPLAAEAMIIQMECKICYAQISNHALLPCGHCCICRWCSNQSFPRHKGDRTRPANRLATCPMCRKPVKQIVEVYFG